MTATPLPHERIFVGLDTAEVDKAARLAKLLAGAVGGVKIGKEFFTAQGPDGVRLAVGGAPLFLDLKFHDIPNTVAGAVRAAVDLRPAILNVHASGGRAMMAAAAEAARETAEEPGIARPRVVRSEEHTSELQSLMRISYAVFCLKKKKQK